RGPDRSQELRAIWIVARSPARPGTGRVLRRPVRERSPASRHLRAFRAAVWNGNGSAEASGRAEPRGSRDYCRGGSAAAHAQLNAAGGARVASRTGVPLEVRHIGTKPDMT